MYLTKDELDRGFAFRSRRRVEKHYRIGDIRKTVDNETGYSFGTKVEITELIVLPDNDVFMKVCFKKVKQ
jgi:hypothetical protein